MGTVTCDFEGPDSTIQPRDIIVTSLMADTASCNHAGSNGHARARPVNELAWNVVGTGRSRDDRPRLLKPVGSESPIGSVKVVANVTV